MDAAYVIVALPLLGAVVLLFAGRRTGDPASGWFATLMAAGSFVATIVVWATLLGRSASDRTVDKTIFTWIPVDTLHVKFGLQLDPLSVVWCLFVTGVGGLITLYSIGYMKGDSSYGRFFFYMNLFLFSMIVLVLADNFLFSFLGWEGVGFCSYGLVGFWFERNTAAVAAKKAFVTNRIGDFGFMIALFLIFGHFHSFDYSTVLAPLSAGHATLADVTATAIGLLLFLGAVGKSAQIPLYMWLPDAMEGPTPVSALIHAATMVTAGVYLVARAAPIIHFSSSTQWVIACIGAATALFAATIACAQDDIKRVLAYSTISQLGYMFLAEGSGGYDAGIYHTVMHAFFKAALFLSAGAVIHALHDEQNMKRMGALWRYLPVTRWAFMAGFLALAAIPPFDGFWSKDDVLQAAWHKSPALWVIGVVTAGLTAYYMSRQVVLVFGGQSRWVEHTAAHGAAGTAGAFGSADSGQGDSAGAPHEAPWVMTLPLIVLGIASTIGWLINAPFGGLDFLDKWLAPVFPSTIAPAVQVSTGTKWTIGIIATGVAFIGLYVGLRVWVRGADQPALEPAVLTHGWYVDEGVAAVVSGPVSRMANDVGYDVDIGFFDGIVNGVAWLTAQTGRQLRRLQTGYVRNYALGIGVGAVILLAYFAARVGELIAMTSSLPILTIIILLPAVGAAVVALIPPSSAPHLVKPVGLSAAVLELAAVIYLVVDFKAGQAGFQFVSQHSWLSQFGISWNVGVDGISLFLVAMTALLFPVAMVGPAITGNARAFMFWMLILEAACMGTFLALDLFLFFVMFEVTLVPGYFIISGWGGLRRNYAAMKFFIYTFAGSAFLLVGILALVLLTAPANHGHQTFDLVTLTRLAGGLPHSDQVLIFLAFAVAFAVKIPLVPFHSWLPAAYTEAPTAGSMILAGILFKLGAYGLLRLGVFILPRGAADAGPLLLTLAAVGIVYGALVTVVQRDLKRLVAYASIVDVAFIVLGIFAFSSQGVTGGVMEMVNHGLTTGAIFFLVGVIWERRGTLRISDLGGLQKTTPILAAIFLAVVLSAIGLPGLNGFVGEFLVLVGTFITHRWWAVVGTTAVVSGAIYMLWAYQRVFHGPIRLVANEKVRDISWREIGAVAPLLAGIVFLGIYPKPFLDRVTPSVNHLLAHVQTADPNAHVPAFGQAAIRYSVPSDQDVDNGNSPSGNGSAAAAGSSSGSGSGSGSGSAQASSAPGGGR